MDPDCQHPTVTEAETLPLSSVSRWKNKETFHPATGHGGLNISLKLPHPPDSVSSGIHRNVFSGTLYRLHLESARCWGCLPGTQHNICIESCPLEPSAPLQMWATMLPESRAAVALRWPFQLRSQNKFHSGKAACSQERVRLWTDSEFASVRL